MGFDKADAWGKKFIDKITKPYIEGQTFEIPRDEKNALWFKMNEKQMDNFDKATKVEDQEKILRNFMDEVINYPELLNKKA